MDKQTPSGFLYILFPLDLFDHHLKASLTSYSYRNGDMNLGRIPVLKSRYCWRTRPNTVKFSKLEPLPQIAKVGRVALKLSLGAQRGFCPVDKILSGRRPSNQAKHKACLSLQNPLVSLDYCRVMCIERMAVTERYSQVCSQTPKGYWCWASHLPVLVSLGRVAHPAYNAPASRSLDGTQLLISLERAMTKWILCWQQQGCQPYEILTQHSLSVSHAV